MVKCPFCQFDNEDGALFCDQCKSDLGILEPVSSSPPVQPTEDLNRSVEKPEPARELSALVEPFTPVPVAVPIRSQQSPMLDDIPIATAVPPAPPVPVEREVEGPLTPVPKAIPVHSNENGSEAPPTVPVPFVGAATISSLETYTAPSKASATPQSPEPATPRVRDTDVIPTGGKPRLRVLRGQKVNVEYPLYEGDNFIGRADERPVDIDLEDQEPPDRIWSSRQHALIHYENEILVIEDLNSSNGTFINRSRLYPGQKRVLMVNDIIQIGTVQMKLVSSP
jgi:hypothetical protein